MLGMDNTLCLWDIKPFCLGSRCKRIYKGHTVYFLLLLLLRIIIFIFYFLFTKLFYFSFSLAQC